MKMFGFTIELYAKTHLIAKCYGNEYVLTIDEKMFTGTIMFSCLGQLMKGLLAAFEVLFKNKLKLYNK